MGHCKKIPSRSALKGAIGIRGFVPILRYEEQSLNCP